MNDKKYVHVTYEPTFWKMSNVSRRNILKLGSKLLTNQPVIHGWLFNGILSKAELRNRIIVFVSVNSSSN